MQEVRALAQNPSSNCPPATQDIAINLKNRKNAIDTAMYGPLNPAEPNEEYWATLGSEWNVDAETAKQQRCGNCAVFIQTPEMLSCIEDGLTDNSDEFEAIDAAGELGYCEIFDFKCASARTCRAWVAGGPVTASVITIENNKLRNSHMNVQKPELVNVLAVGLSDSIVLSLKIQGAHWNVMGPDFAQYHEFFQEIYEDVYSAVDPFAENIRRLGAMAPSKLVEFASMTNVEDTEVGYMCIELTKDILSANSAVLDHLKRAFKVAEMFDEEGIANFIAERIDMHSKWDWQLKATTAQGI
jgi:starvation-inducible DNA-binding protein